MLVFFCTKRKTGNLHPLPITVFLDFLGVQLLIRIFGGAGERSETERALSAPKGGTSPIGRGKGRGANQSAKHQFAEGAVLTRSRLMLLNPADGKGTVFSNFA